MKVIVYHPSKQHIYRVVEGLSLYEVPYKFYTGMFKNCENSGVLATLLSQYLERFRYSERINVHNVRCINFMEELYFTIWGKLGVSYRKRNRALFKKQLRFQKKLLKLLPEDTSHIITFHTNAFYLYKHLQVSGFSGTLILEAAQPHPVWLLNLYQRLTDYKEFLPLNYTEEMVRSYAEEFNYADIVIAPSTFVKNTLIENKVSAEKIILNFHGFNPLNTEEFDKEFSKKDNLKVAFTGVISPSKGFHHLKDVAKATTSFAEYHIFGKPVNKNIMHSLPENIYYHGFVKHNELFEFYKEMNVFYFPTLYDASGLALLEAMNMGLVPIASANSIAPDVIIHEDNGFIIQPENIDSTIHYLELLHKDRELLRDMSFKTKEKIRDFTWEKYQKRYAEIIKGVS